MSDDTAGAPGGGLFASLLAERGVIVGFLENTKREVASGQTFTVDPHSMSPG